MITAWFAGLPATNGRVDFTYNCFGLVTQQGTTRVKMKDGNAIYPATMQQNTGCNFFTPNLKGRGGKKVSMDTNANVMVNTAAFATCP